jgi:hypothetical protein
MFNCALLGKWLWHYVNERGMVESCGDFKFGSLCGWCSNEP